MSTERPRLVGINHVALEVGDLDAAVEFYGAIFELRGVDFEPGMAFIDMGDQFLALSRGRSQAADTNRHFGLVVDDRSEVMTLAVVAGATIPEGRPFNFLDPWGNRIEIVEYRDIQFTKTQAILDALGVAGAKSQIAKEELRKKNFL